jgi:hypothetical protein
VSGDEGGQDPDSQGAVKKADINCGPKLGQQAKKKLPANNEGKMSDTVCIAVLSDRNMCFEHKRMLSKHFCHKRPTTRL